MRLLELEINNVRGITHLPLKPEGGDLLVYGPNGSGKSAVVDAIDFLLTGRISRLTGEGTAGITLTKHGPHIDHQPKDATVRALVELPGLKEPVELRRSMADPNTLQHDEAVAPYLEPVIALARQGQHVLTRRDILMYIRTEAGHRAEAIQELLNVSDVEDIRKALVKVRNDFDRDRQAAANAVHRSEGAVNSTLQREAFQEDDVLRIANQDRQILGGHPISVLRSTDLKKGLRPPSAVPSDQAVNITLLQRDIQNLRNVTSPEGESEIATTDAALREVIETVRSEPELLRALQRLELTKLGIELIDETGSCPLCDTSWPPGRLREYLEQRLSTAERATQYQDRITSMSSGIGRAVNNAIGSMEQVVEAAERLGLTDELGLLRPWLADTKELSVALSDAVTRYPVPRFGMDDVKRMLAPQAFLGVLDRIHSAAKEICPPTNPEQTAWDTLTRLEENLKGLETAADTLGLGTAWYKKAVILLQSFQDARDAVLGRLYEDVSERFMDFYKRLHGSDEAGFSARMAPEGAALNFEVDFYGRGAHPPHALHSEGHQDSMGVCLYLALAEQLTQGIIDLIILDDVVISIDADHRREMCRLLADLASRRQFLITTHDRTWANQLKSEGLVDSRRIVEFYNWSVETGPCVDYEVDMWNRIEEDLRRNDVPAAAGRLRRGSERFFGMACDALQASVTYKLNGLWELGDFLPAAMGQYRSLLKQAKNAAQSWGHREEFEALQDFDSTVGPIYARSGAERWAVDASVHYNSWADLWVNDFRPVVEAFQDLCGLFLCSACGGMLRLATTDHSRVSVGCPCEEVHWNLQEKTSAT